jgi:deazaflavin-dependent oxidoreductase (nitroreductase family)
VPLPRALGRFNARVTNRLLGPVVTLVPSFVWLEHQGRRTGHRYRTPVLLFGSGSERVVAMTYGPTTDWARNVLAAGGAVAIGRGGRRVTLTEPRLVHDPTRRLVPAAIRPVLALLGSSDFLVLEVIGGAVVASVDARR